VAPERPFPFICGGIPDSNRIVVRTGREPTAVRREGYDVRAAIVALRRLFAFACGGIPDPDHPVARSGREPAAVGRKGYGLDAATMALEHLLADVPIVFNAFNARYIRQPFGPKKPLYFALRWGEYKRCAVGL
jgi:hypothetical protein